VDEYPDFPIEHSSAFKTARLTIWPALPDPEEKCSAIPTDEKPTAPIIVKMFEPNADVAANQAFST
jgi:hypothetical protein